MASAERLLCFSEVISECAMDSLASLRDSWASFEPNFGLYSAVLISAL